jgi:hypothetical protein
MKTLSKLSLVFLFVVTACTKESSNNEAGSSNFLVGKWKTTAYIE